MTKQIIILSVLVSLISCKKNNQNDIIIRDDLMTHQSVIENIKLRNTIKNIIEGDEREILELIRTPTAGGSGSYDLGFILTQIIYKVSEPQFLQMIKKIEDKQIIQITGLINVGLEYGDHNNDGLLDDYHFKQEFPLIYTYLNTQK